MRLFSLIFMASGLLFVGIGGFLAGLQHHKLTTYVPVQARVVAKAVEVRQGEDSPSYTPTVTYRYTYNGRELSAEQLQPITVSSSSRGWAQKLIDRYEIGQDVTAYVDPASPGDAYLLREPGFFPYIFVLFPMLFVSIGLGLFLAGSETQPREQLEQDIEGWHRLPAASRIRSKSRATIAVAGLWWCVGLLVLVHWVSLDGEWRLLPAIGMGVYAAVGLIPVVMASRYVAIGRRYGEPVVLVDNPTPHLGDTVTIYFEQTTHQNVELSEVILGLRLKHTYTTGSGKNRSTHTVINYQDEEPVTRDQSAAAGDAVRFSRTIMIPTDQQPTQKQRWTMRYNWVVYAKTDARTGADYQGEFPIMVLSAATSAA